MRRLSLDLREPLLAEFCRRWKVSELALFGSALRDDFKPESDVDVLVAFAPDARWSLLDLVKMQDELSSLLKRPVDLLTRRAVERSQNWIRRKAILESAEVVYAAR
jgi:predicted nucleotidyltransferase